MESQGLEVEAVAQVQLYSKFEASLGYVIPCLKKKDKITITERLRG